MVPWRDYRKAMRIDAHHHFWRFLPEEYPWISPDMAPLRRDFGPEDLAPLIQGSNIDGVITVQARQSIEETHKLLALAEEHTFVKGVVGWAPLCDADQASQLEELAQSSKLKAIRHVVQEEPPGFLLREDFNLGVRQLSRLNLVFDLLVRGPQLAEAVEFVDRHPEQVFVLDHIAKPRVSKSCYDADWDAGFRRLAERENLACKFSGVVTEVVDPQWTVDLVRPYWDTAVEAFGPRRLMFGSDWPVCLLKTTYRRWLDVVEGFTNEWSATEQCDFWGNNSAMIYSL